MGTQRVAGERRSLGIAKSTTTPPGASASNWASPNRDGRVDGLVADCVVEVVSGSAPRHRVLHHICAGGMRWRIDSRPLALRGPPRFLVVRETCGTGNGSGLELSIGRKLTKLAPSEAPGSPVETDDRRDLEGDEDANAIWLSASWSF